MRVAWRALLLGVSSLAVACEGRELAVFELPPLVAGSGGMAGTPSAAGSTSDAGSAGSASSGAGSGGTLAGTGGGFVTGGGMGGSFFTGGSPGFGGGAPPPCGLPPPGDGGVRSGDPRGGCGRGW